MHVEITPMVFVIALFALIVVLFALYRKGDVSAHIKWWGGAFSFEAREKQSAGERGKTLKP
jgi:hypothetical protein